MAGVMRTRREFVHQQSAVLRQKHFHREHTHEIAKNVLGLSEQEIRKLDEEKVLY